MSRSGSSKLIERLERANEHHRESSLPWLLIRGVIENRPLRILSLTALGVSVVQISFRISPVWLLLKAALCSSLLVVELLDFTVEKNTNRAKDSFFAASVMKIRPNNPFGGWRSETSS